MQFWSVSPQNGLKMCAFLRSITWATGCNRFKLVRLRCLKSMQPQPPVQSSSVFGLFLVLWTGPLNTSITFCPQLLELFCPTPTLSARVAKLPPQNPASPKPFDSTLRVSLIGAAAFGRACKLLGAQSFKIHLSNISISGKSASVSDKAPDLSHIHKEYHDYADVFSKAKADTLAPHHPYDLQINLEEGASPLVGTVWELSQSKLSALHEFLDEHVHIGFIQQSSSPHGAPVLFICKKDRSLRLCVDFRGLNRISKKDCYHLPIISDLLSTAGKARIYTTINLHHAYHLVRIPDRDEWKTAFQTCYGSFEWLVMPSD